MKSFLICLTFKQRKNNLSDQQHEFKITNALKIRRWSLEPQGKKCIKKAVASLNFGLLQRRVRCLKNIISLDPLRARCCLRQLQVYAHLIGLRQQLSNFVTCYNSASTLAKPRASFRTFKISFGRSYNLFRYPTYNFSLLLCSYLVSQELIFSQRERQFLRNRGFQRRRAIQGLLIKSSSFRE